MNETHHFLLFFLLMIAAFVKTFEDDHQFCSTDTKECSDSPSVKSKRYLLYNVNPGEGFNLRRDVYMRVANFVHKLNQEDNWVLVLPPWGGLYHWRNERYGNFRPWGDFFDITSMQRHVPVIEFEDYIKDFGSNVEHVFWLQQYAEGWKDGKFEEKYDFRSCIEHNPFEKTGGKKWTGELWGKAITTDKFECVSAQGVASVISPLLSTAGRTVMIGRAEVLLHDKFGSQQYWAARRSLRFASHLQEAANELRSNMLNSTDALDHTQLPDDWTQTEAERARALGGPYVAAHLRRRDFARYRSDQIPTLKQAATKVKELLKTFELDTLFLATDASKKEVSELRELLLPYRLVQFIPSLDWKKKWGDGGEAIVDQIVCAYSRYFIGTHESTFSFRIQEEREILGFKEESTFNRFCGPSNDCERPSRWTIVY